MLKTWLYYRHASLALTTYVLYLRTRLMTSGQPIIITFKNLIYYVKMNINKNNFNLIGQAVSDAAMTKDERLLLAQRITPETDLPPMQPLFRMFDTPCFYRGELVADCGKAKSGKTTFLSVLMTAAVIGDCLAVERQATPLKVLWIDTEQSQQSTQEILRDRILSLAKCPAEELNERIFAFNLRGMGYEIRRRMVEVAIMTVRPDLVILDGIKDLVTDINDAVQATLIMEQLMALAKLQNCCIVNILHQNKSEADHNMRGSIGTELTNKAFEVFQCEFLERHQMFKVSQTLSRRQKLKRDFYYRLTDEGLPECCDIPKEQPRDEHGRWISNKDALVKFFNEAMEGRTQRKFNELMAVAMKKCGVADAKTYYDLIRDAEQQGILRKAEHPETKETWVVLTEDGTLPF